MNDKQKSYIADSLKIAAWGQLALIGAKQIQDGRVAIAWLTGSLLVWVIFILLGVQILNDDGDQ